MAAAVPEKTKVATKYGMKIFHGKDRSREMTLMNLLLIETFKSTKLNFQKLHFN